MKKAIKIIYITFAITALGMIIFGVARLASAKDVIGTITLSTTTEEFTGAPQLFTAGDYNNDGEVNSDDAIYLLMHIQFKDVYDGAYPISQSADINKDGRINTDDAIYLLLHTQFNDSYPI